MSIFSDIQRDKIPQYRSCGIEIIKTRARIFFHNQQRLVLSVDKSRHLTQRLPGVFCALSPDVQLYLRVFPQKCGRCSAVSALVS